MRAAGAVLTILIVALIIHIVAVLTIPRFATESPFIALYDGLPFHRTEVLGDPSPAGAPIAFMDPQLIYALCRFSMDEGPVGVTLPLLPTYWSLSVISRDRTTHFSVNDRTAGDLERGIIIVPEPDVALIEAALLPGEEPPLIIPFPRDEGVAVFRVLTPFASNRPHYRGRASEYACAPESGS